jgi:hypothetical protein
MQKEDKINPLTYFERVRDPVEIIGGLSFNTPVFTMGSMRINVKDNKDSDHYDQIIEENKNNSIIMNIGQKITFDMINQNKTPIVIDNYTDHDNTMHGKLSQLLQNKGVIDMLLKLKDQDIIIPNELSPLKDIINKIITFEKKTNPDFESWNMWILVDIRPFTKGTTQRNSGFHYDGFNMVDDIEKNKWYQYTVRSGKNYTVVFICTFFDSNKKQYLYLIYFLFDKK